MVRAFWPSNPILRWCWFGEDRFECCCRYLIISDWTIGQQGKLRLSIRRLQCGYGIFEHEVGIGSLVADVSKGDQLAEIRDLNRVDWIKVDVEGHEYRAIAGLRATIALHNPVVFLEWNRQERRFSELCALFPPGYSFYRFSGDQNILGVFARPGYRLRHFATDVELGLCNVLAWPPIQMPLQLRRNLCR